MSASLMPMPKQAFYGTVNGVHGPIVGGKVYTYEAGTTTPKATYTTAAGNVANPNPVVLDARGEASVWLGFGAYDIVLKGADDAQIWTQDGVRRGSDSSTIDFQQAGTGAVGRTAQAKMREIVSVKDFGAVGDGVADDTAAIRAALTYACVTTGVGVFIPAGRYKISATLNLSPSVVSSGQNHLKIDVYGEGNSSQLLQYVDGPVFSFTGLTHQVSFRDFTAIVKVEVSGSAATLGNKALFYFPDGNSQSFYQNITYSADPGETTVGGSFYVCGTGKNNDTVSFINCMVSIKHWGYKIGKGSSVFLYGGRVIGSYPTLTGGIGLYYTGGNGGCWAWATDFISHNTAILCSQDSGTSNREILLTHTCVDGSNIGLSIIDSSYTTWTGVWAASCNQANIDYAPASDAALLNISGGTVFNAGNLGAGTPGQMYGLSVNAYGKLNITGVTFRNNKGRAISINSGARTAPCNIQGCLFYENGDTGVSASAQLYLAGRATFMNNELVQGTGSYAVPVVRVDENNSTNLYVADNRGYQGYDLRTTKLTLGASDVNVTNTLGQRLIGYFRSGTVNSVWVNDAPVYDFGAGSGVNCQIILNPGDRYKVVYSAAPNITWYYA